MNKYLIHNECVTGSSYDNHEDIVNNIKQGVPLSDIDKNKVYRNFAFMERNEIDKNSLKEAYYEIYKIICNHSGKEVLTMSSRTTFSFNDLTSETLWNIYLYTVRYIEDIKRSKVIKDAMSEYDHSNERFKQTIKFRPKKMQKDISQRADECEQTRYRKMKKLQP